MNKNNSTSDITSNHRLWTHWARHILGTNPTKEHLVLERNGEDLTPAYRKVLQAWDQLNQVTRNDPKKGRKSWNTVVRKIKHRERNKKVHDIKKFCVYGILWAIILIITVWAVFN
ncbi:hypothetical protein OAT16_01320 [Prolixibacteraceae bacterium]|nr:hypothetical protein [Prolixibacteraceae bacterium]